MGFPDSSDGTESACNARRPGFNSWVGKIPWRRESLPTPVLQPGEFHGERSLVDYSPWSHKELDTIEQLSQGISGSSAGKESTSNAVPRLGRSIGEGIGYPPQYCQDSLVAQKGKNLPARGWEDPVEKGMATDSSILA